MYGPMSKGCHLQYHSAEMMPVLGIVRMQHEEEKLGLFGRISHRWSAAESLHTGWYKELNMRRTARPMRLKQYTSHERGVM